MTESIDPADTVSYDDVRDQAGRDDDPVASLRDTEEEQGDEAEVTDDFDLDETAAKESGTDFDRLGGETPRLD
jgi:hypothetical protein